uniref:Microtubule-associated protein futsch n=1 Tax=Timema douglasi TaxID=61478 RepID=A0A7R8Z2U0_TIMDO|nr:unnamed protein product [Timema douglasi]
MASLVLTDSSQLTSDSQHLGERLIQYATENLVTEVLIHPQLNTLSQCIRNLLSSFTRHRHLIHAGYTFAGNGSWILQDGTFSLADFVDAFQETEVQRVLRAYDSCVTVDVHCSPEGDWTTQRLNKETFSRSCKVRVNPDDRLTAGGPAISSFLDYINPFLIPASLEQLLEPSDVVGNIRFSHPTLYVFPGGQGDAALFGINGFNMLVDGGFNRKACFWDFARHLDRLDAVLVTRLNNGNVNGISAVLRRKKQSHVYPQIGHFFCNLQSISPSASTVTMTSRAGIKHKSTPAVLDKILPGEGIAKTPSKPLEINKQQVAKSATIPVTGGQTEEKKTKPSTPVSTLTTPTTTKAPPQAKVKIEKAASKTEPPKPKTESNKPIEGEKIKGEKSTKPTPDVKPKEHKSKIDSKSSTAKSRIDSKPPRSLERKSQKISTTTPVGEKKAEVKSSPTTPKKSVESKVNGVASKAEISKVSRAASKSRQSPTSTPAKSTKEANNRKVVESKYNVSRAASTSRAPTPKSTKKEPDNASTTVKSERKPISRRPKPASPSKTGKSPSSPAKSSSAKSTPTPSVKSEKDGVIRKVRGEPDKAATDSSAVSTPSTAEPETGPLKVKVLPIEETPAFAESKHINETVQDKVLSADVENLDLEKPKHKKESSGAVEATSILGPIKTEEFEGKQGYDVNDTTETEEVIEETKISPIALGTTSQEETEDEEVAEAKELVALGEDEHDERQDVEITEEERTEDIEDEDIVIEPGKSLQDEMEFEEKHGEINVEEKYGEEDEDEEEYLIIEKEEVDQVMKNSLQDQESFEISGSNEKDNEEEGELKKHSRDEGESEKEKKHAEEKEKTVVNGLEGDKIIEESKTYFVPDEKEQLDDSFLAKNEVDSVCTAKDVSKVAKQTEEKTYDENKEIAVSVDHAKTIDVTLDKEKVEQFPPETKEQIQEEVQEIISSAKEIVSSKLENEKNQDDLQIKPKDTIEHSSVDDKKEVESDEQKEISSISPEEKLDNSSEKNREITDETRDSDQKLLDEEHDDGVEIKGTGLRDMVDQKYPAEESQPDEKFSTTVESGATTAPTLPEDERIPLDEIKEIIEEKHVKEETKEDKPTTILAPHLEQPTTLPQVFTPSNIGVFDTRGPQALAHQRDIVKTPDEVADLPVHEEVDPGMYEGDEFNREFPKSKDDTLFVKKQTEVEDRHSPELEVKGKLSDEDKKESHDNIENAEQTEVVSALELNQSDQKENKDHIDKKDISTTVEEDTNKMGTDVDEKMSNKKEDFSQDAVLQLKLESDKTKDERATDKMDGLEHFKHAEAESSATSLDNIGIVVLDNKDVEEKMLAKDKLDLLQDVNASNYEMTGSIYQETEKEDKEIEKEEYEKPVLGVFDTKFESEEKKIAEDLTEKENFVETIEVEEERTKKDSKTEKTTEDLRHTSDSPEDGQAIDNLESSSMKEVKIVKDEIKDITNRFIEMERNITEVCVNNKTEDTLETYTIEKLTTEPESEKTDIEKPEPLGEILEKTESVKVPHVDDEITKKDGQEDKPGATISNENNCEEDIIKSKPELSTQPLEFTHLHYAEKVDEDQLDNEQESKDKTEFVKTDKDIQIDSTKQKTDDMIPEKAVMIEDTKHIEERHKPQENDESDKLELETTGIKDGDLILETVSEIINTKEEQAKSPTDIHEHTEETKSEDVSKFKSITEPQEETISKFVKSEPSSKPNGQTILMDDKHQACIDTKDETILETDELKSSSKLKNKDVEDDKPVHISDTISIESNDKYNEEQILEDSLQDSPVKDITSRLDIDATIEKETPVKDNLQSRSKEILTDDINNISQTNEMLDEVKEKEETPCAISAAYLEIIEKLQQDQSSSEITQKLDERVANLVSDSHFISDVKKETNEIEESVLEKVSAIKDDFTNEKPIVNEHTNVINVDTLTKEPLDNEGEELTKLNKAFEPILVEEKPLDTEEFDIDLKIGLATELKPSNEAVELSPGNKTELSEFKGFHIESERREHDLDDDLGKYYEGDIEEEDDYVGSEYIDSGLEEEPVYGKLAAAALPEYVTVTPDSAPPSPGDYKFLERKEDRAKDVDSTNRVDRPLQQEQMERSKCINKQISHLDKETKQLEEIKSKSPASLDKISPMLTGELNGDISPPRTPFENAKELDISHSPTKHILEDKLGSGTFTAASTHHIQEIRPDSGISSPQSVESGKVKDVVIESGNITPSSEKTQGTELKLKASSLKETEQDKLTDELTLKSRTSTPDSKKLGEPSDEDKHESRTSTPKSNDKLTHEVKLDSRTSTPDSAKLGEPSDEDKHGSRTSTPKSIDKLTHEVKLESRTSTPDSAKLGEPSDEDKHGSRTSTPKSIDKLTQEVKLDSRTSTPGSTKLGEPSDEDKHDSIMSSPKSIDNLTHEMKTNMTQEQPSPKSIDKLTHEVKLESRTSTPSSIKLGELSDEDKRESRTSTPKSIDKLTQEVKLDSRTSTPDSKKLGEPSDEDKRESRTSTPKSIDKLTHEVKLESRTSTPDSKKLGDPSDEDKHESKTSSPKSIDKLTHEVKLDSRTSTPDSAKLGDPSDEDKHDSRTPSPKSIDKLTHEVKLDSRTSTPGSIKLDEDKHESKTSSPKSIDKLTHEVKLESAKSTPRSIELEERVKDVKLESRSSTPESTDHIKVTQEIKSESRTSTPRSIHPGDHLTEHKSGTSTPRSTDIDNLTNNAKLESRTSTPRSDNSREVRLESDIYTNKATDLVRASFEERLDSGTSTPKSIDLAEHLKDVKFESGTSTPRSTESRETDFTHHELGEASFLDDLDRLRKTSVDISKLSTKVEEILTKAEGKLEEMVNVEGLLGDKEIHIKEPSTKSDFDDTITTCVEVTTSHMETSSTQQKSEKSEYDSEGKVDKADLTFTNTVVFKNEEMVLPLEVVEAQETKVSESEIIDSKQKSILEKSEITSDEQIADTYTKVIAPKLTEGKLTPIDVVTETLLPTDLHETKTPERKSSGVSDSDTSDITSTTVPEIGGKLEERDIISHEPHGVVSTEHTTYVETSSNLDVDHQDAPNSTTVRRMVVTASSEDGGVETEVCESGSITYTSKPETDTFVSTSSHDQDHSRSNSSSPEQTASEHPSSSIQVELHTKIQHDHEQTQKDYIEEKTDLGYMVEKSPETNGHVYSSDKYDNEDILYEDDNNSVGKAVSNKTSAQRDYDSDEDIVQDYVTRNIYGGRNYIMSPMKAIRTTHITVTKTLSDESDDIHSLSQKSDIYDSHEDVAGSPNTFQTTTTYMKSVKNLEDEDADVRYSSQESIASGSIPESSKTSTVTTKTYTTALKSLEDGEEAYNKVQADTTVTKPSTSKTITTVTKTISGDGEIKTVTITKEISLGDEVGHTVVTTNTYEDGEIVEQQSEVKNEYDQHYEHEKSLPRLENIQVHKEDISSAISKEVKVTPLDISTVEKVISEISGVDSSLINLKDKDEHVNTVVEEKTVIKDKDGVIETVVTKATKETRDLEESIDKGDSTTIITIKKESSDIGRSGTPGSDALSDRELDFGGPLTPHSDVSSGQASRAPTHIWGESIEGRPDSEEDEDGERAGSPLSISSQLAHSPLQYEHEISEPQVLDIKTKSSSDLMMESFHEENYVEAVDLQKKCSDFAMTSSLYGNLPPEPLRQPLEKHTTTHLTEDQDTTSTETTGSSFSAGFGKDKIGTTTKTTTTTYKYFTPGDKDPSNEENLDFERALREHRLTRGEDLAPTTSTVSYHIETKSSPSHTYKYEHSSTGMNGHKHADDFEVITASKSHKDLANKNLEVNGKHNGNRETSILPSDDKRSSSFHQEILNSTKDVMKDDITTSSIEHDPMFHHQFASSSALTSGQALPEPPHGFDLATTGKADDKKDPIESWGKPLGLPAPAPPPTKDTNTSGEIVAQTNKGTPKKEKKTMQMKKTIIMNENNKANSATKEIINKKRPESPVKQAERKGSSINKDTARNAKLPGSPIYVDLTYVPHHGNAYYTSVEFFKKVRARYYVFSGTDPSREVYNALLEAKQTWEDKELEVTIIPTYDTDTLGYWVAENEDILAKCKIDLSPSASRCTINLQDHETSCSAYRLEF